MGVRSRSKRRRGASARGADLLSGLCDDVLLLILDRLPNAADAVRTGALSRRWRGLWRRAGSLTFDPASSRRKLKRAGDYYRFLAFVNDALAQRATADDGGAEADLEHLAISLAVASPVGKQQLSKRLVLRSAEAAREWIQYATQGTVKSFVLKLRLLLPTPNHLYQPEQPMLDLSDLPAASSAKLETMHWELEGVRLRLPATAVFPSLVDLLLEDVQLSADDSHLLARLLSSSCCPPLQKLQLRKLITVPELFEDFELLIDASALLELSISIRTNPWTLKLKAPSLRILHFEDNYLDTLEISAPRLEELTFLTSQPDYIVVDGELPCMGRLIKIDVFSHRDEYDYNHEYDINIGSICLLRCCTSLTCLEVSLQVTKSEYVFTDDIISGRIPHLPHLISLTVHAFLLDLHLFGVGLAEILKQCNNLKYLVVNCIQMGGRDLSLCKHPNHWKFDQIYLANIQKVQFTGLAGTDCESSIVQGVLAHGRQLQKVALSFDPRSRPYNVTDCSRFIPCGGGTWRVCHNPSLSYEWDSDPIMRIQK